MGNFPNVPYVNIGKIKSLAKEQGLSLKYLCSYLGKNGRVFFANVKNGIDRMDAHELSLIADKLNTTSDYLTDKTDQKEKPTAVTGEQKVPFENIMALLSDLPEDQIDQILACVERFVQIPEDKLPQALEYLEYLSKLK